MSTIVRKYEDFVRKNQSNYFAFISMIILVGGIWGGVTSMFIDKSNGGPVQLAINIGVTMACTVSVLGQAPFKWVLNLFILSVVVNAILIGINAF